MKTSLTELFNLKRTTINIFDGEDIKYIINADSSTLLDNYKIIKEDKYKKLFNHEFIFYYYLTKENFNGIYLNSLIDYVYKNYDLKIRPTARSP